MEENANYSSNARSKARAQDTLLDDIQHNERCMCRIISGGIRRKREARDMWVTRLGCSVG